MSNNSEDNDAGRVNDPRLLREAQQGEFARFTKAMEDMREMLTLMNTRLDAIERATSNHNGRHREGSMDMPYFRGEDDPYVYVQWVQQMEDKFDSLEISDSQKCRIATRKFSGYAAIWWKDLMNLRKINGYSEVRSWEVMKRLMTRHFIPEDVRDKFYVKLQRLKQSDEMSVDEYIKKFKLFIIASDVGGSERWQVTKFISGFKHEIASRLEMAIYFQPKSLKVIIQYALEYEKIVSVFEKIECQSMKNDSVEIIEVVEQQDEEKSNEEECQDETSPPKTTFEDPCINQQSEEFPSSFGNTLGREIDLVERKKESELSVKIELSEKSEDNGKHLVRENKPDMSEEKKLEIESIKEDNKLVIHHDYANNFNFSFSSVLNVVLQNFKPYKDPFDDVVEVPYAYKSIHGGFIHSKKNLRYSCCKYKRKQPEFQAYKFVNGSSMFQVCKQVQVVLKLFVWIRPSKKKFSSKLFVFDPGGHL